MCTIHSPLTDTPSHLCLLLHISSSLEKQVSNLVMAIQAGNVQWSPSFLRAERYPVVLPNVGCVHTTYTSPYIRGSNTWTYSLVPRPARHFWLQATKIWVGPGNEATEHMKQLRQLAIRHTTVLQGCDLPEGTANTKNILAVCLRLMLIAERSKASTLDNGSPILS